MIQEQKPLLKIGSYAISTGQLLVGLLVSLVVAFLIIGSVNKPPSDDISALIAPSQSFLVLAFLAFAGGLLSFLSPCTLPILPAYFAFAFRGGRSAILTNTLSFLFGLATMFTFLGAGASALGTLLYKNNYLILLLGGTFIILFGLMSLIGRGFSGIGTGEGERAASTWGSFIFGLTFAVGWSSCTGPILGIVLSLAATTASVLRGMMLLFIYALGLGLPLMLVSALFGRASRDSFFWRALRGKGWSVEVANYWVGLLWGFGGWLILVPLLTYAFPTWQLTANPILHTTIPFLGTYILIQYSAIQLGLLVACLLLGALGSIVLQGGIRPNPLELHSTQLISGLLFLLMGILLINNQLSIFNGLADTSVATALLEWEDKFLALFR